MAYANITHTYSGGARTFNTGFETGVRAAADIRAWVVGELDGEGNQVYRAFSYDADTGVVTITNAIGGPYPRRVKIKRVTPITNPAVDFDAGAVISRANLNRAVLQSLRGVQEAHDNDALIAARVVDLEELDIQGQINEAVDGVLEDAQGYAAAASRSAGNAATRAGQAATQVSLAAAQVALAEDQVDLAAAQVALAEDQVDLAAAQVALAVTARNATEGLRDDTQDIFDAAYLLLGDVIGATAIPCTGVYNAELGTGTLELTSLIEYDTLTAGMVFKVQAPTTSNTYQLLIRLDGGAIAPLKNINGSNVPGPYMRTDVITYLTWDGSNFRAGRAVERGSDANGEWVRFEDGTQICTHSLTGQSTATAAGALFTSATSTTWTFPKTFLTGTLPSCHADVNAAGRWTNVWGVDNTKCAIREFNSASNASTFPLRCQATGRWY